MTKQLADNKQQSAQKVFEELKKWKMIGILSFLKMGYLLKRIKEERLYTLLGEGSPEYETFEGFLRMVEVDIERRKAYYFIQIWTKFVEQLGFKPEDLSGISWTRLRDILPIIRPENSKELIADVKVLSSSDLTIKINQLKAGWDAEVACNHSEISQITFFECNSCKERFKSQPPKSKIIGTK